MFTRRPCAPPILDVNARTPLYTILCDTNLRKVYSHRRYLATYKNLGFEQNNFVCPLFALF